MAGTNRKVIFLLTALAAGFSAPYLIDMAGHALEPQPATISSVSPDNLSASQRLEFACAAVQQMNGKLNRLDPDRPSFLGELNQHKKVRPELQELHRLVCGK